MKSKDKAKFIKNLSFFLFLGIVIFTYKWFRTHNVFPQILEFTEQAGVWAPILFVFIFVLFSGIVVPSLILKILSGALFGIGWGIVLSSVGAMISSTIKFILARFFLRERIQKKIQQSEILTKIDRLIEVEGWKMLMLMRNIPVFNSMFLNYICGVTKMKIKDYIVASFIGRLPSIIVYVYVGYLARYAYMKGFEFEDPQLRAKKILLITGLVAILGTVWYLIHLSRKELRKKAPTIAEVSNL